MKKIIYGAAAAAVALFSACETLAPVDGAMTEGAASDTASEKVVLTATIGNDDTKTYLEWDGKVFKTRWSEDDEFYVLDVQSGWDNSADFELISGAGESTAQFEMTEGTLPASYYAVYGEVEFLDGGCFVAFTPYQDRDIKYGKNGNEIQAFDDWAFPMVAKGSGTDVQFKNIASVLKLSVTGSGETLKQVVVKSNDEGVYLGGYARVNFNGARPSYTLSRVEVNYDGDIVEVPLYDEIRFDPGVYSDMYGDVLPVLSDEPVECYVVLPAQAYPSGLTIQLQTDEGYMEVETENNLVFSQSELREMPTLKYEPTISFAGKWRVEADASGEIGFLAEKEGDYLVLKNYHIDSWACLNFYYGDSKYTWSKDYGYNTTQLTNTCGRLQLCSTDENSGSSYIAIEQEGDYDIYLNPDTLEIFIMTSGVSLSDIPTTEEVFCQDYEKILQMSEGAIIKAYGTVCAVTTKGFMIQLGGGGLPILIYDTSLSGLEIGDAVELYVTKTTYAGLPELKTILWSKVYKNSDHDMYESYYDITQNFDGYASDYYQPISFSGTLSISSSYHNITVDGASRVGSIQSPAIDLSGYNGKKVYLEGYYAGLSGANQQYLNIVLTKIALPDTGGSTEDVVPDEDIVVTPVLITK